jgi:hypothetical protein
VNNTFVLKPSKIYLYLVLSLQGWVLLAIWYYLSGHWAWVLSGLLLVQVRYFYQQWKNTMVKNLGIVDNTLIVDCERYPLFYCSYQSNFLVIITANNRQIVIFKDSLVNASFSQLNKLLNVKS